jgi:hypothetical protein
MVEQTGVRFGLATGALVLTLEIVAALPLGPGDTATVALLAAAGAAATLPRTLMIALGAETWAFWTGFFENRYGVLTLTDHDVLRLAGFVAGTVLLAHLFRAPFQVATGGDRP